MFPSELRNNITQYAFGNELAWLRQTARDLKYVVMIGAGPGIMAMALKEGNPELNLIIVDIATCYYAKAHLEEAGFYGVGYWVDDSAEYGKDYTGPKLDMVLVDGDHTKEGVKRDIQAWFRHVKPGGLLFFHDYENVNGDETNGVADALIDILMDAEEIDTPGISIVYRKNPYA